MQKLYESSIKAFVLNRIEDCKLSCIGDEMIYFDNIYQYVSKLPSNENNAVNLIGFLPKIQNVYYEMKTQEIKDMSEFMKNQLHNCNPNVEDKEMYNILINIWISIIDFDKILTELKPASDRIVSATEYKTLYTLTMIIDELMKASLKIIYADNVFSDELRLAYKKFFDWFDFNYELEYEEILNNIIEMNS